MSRNPLSLLICGYGAALVAALALWLWGATAALAALMFWLGGAAATLALGVAIWRTARTISWDETGSDPAYAEALRLWEQDRLDDGLAAKAQRTATTGR